jgi:hypothetical protein
MENFVCTSFSMSCISLLTSLATIAILICQQRSAKQTNRANFWLKLEEILSIGRRERVHLNIMDKKYTKERFIETDDSYWVDDYLGIFELCFIMMKQRVINLKTFKAIYRYRLIYFLQYELLVKEKLIKEGYYYEYLYKLFSKWSRDKKWKKYWKEKIKNRTPEERKNDVLNNRLYEELKTELIIPFLRKEKVPIEIDNITHY